MTFTIVQHGLIEITEEDGVKDSRPSCSLLKINGCNILIDTEHPKEDGVEFEQAVFNTGLSLDDIDYIIFTHLHPDHMGHKSKFSNAVFIFQSCEKLVFYFRNDKKIELNGSCIMRFAKGLEPEVQYVSEDPEMPLPDDKVYIKLMPGHTPGSSVIFAYINNKVHAFTGDIFLNEDYYNRMEPPGSSWDPEAIPGQMLFIKENADVIIPGHGKPIIKNR